MSAWLTAWYAEDAARCDAWEAWKRANPEVNAARNSAAVPQGAGLGVLASVPVVAGGEEWQRHSGALRDEKAMAPQILGFSWWLPAVIVSLGAGAWWLLR